MSIRDSPINNTFSDDILFPPFKTRCAQGALWSQVPLEDAPRTVPKRTIRR